MTTPTPAPRSGTSLLVSPASIPEPAELPGQSVGSLAGVNFQILPDKARTCVSFTSPNHEPGTAADGRISLGTPLRLCKPGPSTSSGNHSANCSNSASHDNTGRSHLEEPGRELDQFRPAFSGTLLLGAGELTVPLILALPPANRL